MILFKEFLKPTKLKIGLFVFISLFFPLSQIHFLIISFRPAQDSILFLLFGLILLILLLIIPYLLTCILKRINDYLLPSKHWKILFIFFILILVLANIPGIGTTTHSKKAVATSCVQGIGYPCPELTCPPDCIYSLKTHRIFWPWKKPMTFEYRITSYYNETFWKTIPLIGLFHFERSYNSDFLEFSGYYGLTLLLASTFAYWYLLGCLLTHIISSLRSKKPADVPTTSYY